ncbi:MAG: hypothetical protein QM723_32020 [Myxococcaceae bacterium]
MAVSWAELVGAIREHPEDPQRRQIAIDWLLDRGDPRGEFLSRWRSLGAAGGASFTGARAWEERARAIGVLDPEYHDGWLEHAVLAGEHCANAGQLLDLEPVLRLTLSQPAPEVSKHTSALRSLRGLRGLTLDSSWAEPELGPLLGSPHLGALETLKVRSLSRRDATALATSPARPTQMLLHVGPSIGAELASSEVISRVTDLTLLGFECDVPLQEMAGGRLGPLRSLHVNQMLTTSLEKLGARLESVESLWLRRAIDHTLRPLAERRLDKLTDLNLVQPAFTHHALAPFAPALGGLRTLRINRPAFGQPELALLAESLSERLESLAWAINPGLDLSPLLTAPRLTGLRHLALFGVRFDAQVVNAINVLAARGSLRELTHDAYLAEVPGLRAPGVQVNRVSEPPAQP